jgi:hypothetical protein
MRRPKPLIGHALVSLTIVLGSLVALAPSLGVRLDREAPTAGAIAPTQLSTTGRIAYWRTSPGDEHELWAADLEGHRRFPVATSPKKAEPDITRWSPDGDGIAWHADGDVHVVRLDRTRTTVSLPADLREARWRPVGLAWSPDSKRLAATLRPVYGASNEADVFVADLDRTATTWRRVTRTGESLAASWLDDRRLLIETVGGHIGLVDHVDAAGDPSAAAPLPITAMVAVSPRVGADGRLWFFGGKWSGTPVFGAPAAAGSVWSMTLDGADMRRETSIERDHARLEAILPDGRAVVGVPGALYVLGDEPVLFPWKAGGVRRVIVAQDGRRVVALTETRILSVDVTKIPRSLPAITDSPDALTVVLDAVKAPDAWFPSRPIGLARSGRPPDGPRETLTFSFGRALWQLRPGGAMRQLVMPPARERPGWIGPLAAEHARGLIAVPVHTFRPEGGRYVAEVMIFDRSGRHLVSLEGESATVSWSADGSQVGLATWSEAAGPSLQLYDTATWSAGARHERVRGSLTSAGLVLVDEGRAHPAAPEQTWQRVGQTISVIDGRSRRQVSDAETLAEEPRLRDLRAPGLLPSIVVHGAGRDHLLVRITFLDGVARAMQPETALLMIRALDGRVTGVLRARPGHDHTDATWSPTADLVGLTRGPLGPAVTQREGTALVVDPSGALVLERPGRFAGWSHDGQRVYLARPEGLFEVRLDGTDETRVSALGVVPVTATGP